MPPLGHSLRRRVVRLLGLVLLGVCAGVPRWTPSGTWMPWTPPILLYGPQEDTKAVPVVLFLHGGPGFGVQPLAQRLHGPLHEAAIFAYWDQPGTAPDCHRTEPVTAEAVLAEAEAVVDALRARFGVEKVGLVGASWGSVLGLTLLARRPDAFWGYAGEAQVISVARGEQAALAFARSKAESARDERTLAALEGLSPPPLSPREVGTLRRALVRYGGVWGRPGPYVWALVVGGLRPEYALGDKLRYLPCAAASAAALSDWLKAWEAPDLPAGVPVRFFQGRDDFLAPAGVLEDFVVRHSAQRDVEIVWFVGAGHVPSLEQPARYTTIMVEQFLPRGTHYPRLSSQMKDGFLDNDNANF